MVRNVIILLKAAALLLVVMGCDRLPPTATAGSTERSDAEIRNILAERVDTYRDSVGLVVGIVGPEGRRIIAHGSRAPGDPRPVDGDTVFEIGSTTKVFTALLLADMVQRGEVALTDPIAKYLPPEVKVPEWNGRPITLQHLAMHVSGLPRMPRNFRPRDETDLYADYSVGALYQFLSSYELRRDVGSQFEYSNLGMGLLGHILARRAGMSFEELVRARITGPLGLASTAIELSADMKVRLTPGHDERLQRVPNWHLSVFAGGGGLRSSGSDLLGFLAAQLGFEESPLAEAMAAARSARGGGRRQMALGWMVSNVGGKEILWHDGETAGYSTFIGIDLKNRLGVVVLSNSSISVDDIGLHLLTGSFPLEKEYEEVPIDPDLLDGYVGRYRLDDETSIAITREGDRLFAQPATEGRFGLFAKSDREFFSKMSNTRVVFRPGPGGVPNRLVVAMGDREQKGWRTMPVPRKHKEIRVDARVLDRYVGRYQITPSFAITVTRDDNRLFVQATNQMPLRIYPASRVHFFSRDADARFTFVLDMENRPMNLILHQNGYDQLASRVPDPD